MFDLKELIKKMNALDLLPFYPIGKKRYFAHYKFGSKCEIFELFVSQDGTPMIVTNDNGENVGITATNMYIENKDAIRIIFRKKR
jgi:predicted P-loop ATPase/GTPase